MNLKGNRLLYYGFGRMNFFAEMIKLKLFKISFIIFLGCSCITYIVMAVALHFNQEELIFRPKKLDKNYKFKFDVAFEELNIPSFDNTRLNALLFKAQNPKGLVFYLHEKSGALDTWGKVAGVYTELGYDMFILDYRGFGKSEGSIQNEAQFYSDLSVTYKKMLSRYAAHDIVIVGHSLGSGPAAWIASRNNPKALILLAPYYNLTEYGSQRFPFLPAFLHRYSFQTNVYIKDIKLPVYIFHGNRDHIVSCQNSIRLQKIMKTTDHFYKLVNQTQTGINTNEVFRIKLAEILSAVPNRYSLNSSSEKTAY